MFASKKPMMHYNSEKEFVSIYTYKKGWGNGASLIEEKQI